VPAAATRFTPQHGLGSCHASLERPTSQAASLPAPGRRSELPEGPLALFLRLLFLRLLWQQAVARRARITRRIGRAAVTEWSVLAGSRRPRTGFFARRARRRDRSPGAAIYIKLPSQRNTTAPVTPTALKKPNPNATTRLLGRHTWKPLPGPEPLAKVSSPPRVSRYAHSCSSWLTTDVLSQGSFEHMPFRRQGRHPIGWTKSRARSSSFSGAAPVPGTPARLGLRRRRSFWGCESRYRAGLRAVHRG
jgi:hypothetical protein